MDFEYEGGLMHSNIYRLFSISLVFIILDPLSLFHYFLNHLLIFFGFTG